MPKINTAESEVGAVHNNKEIKYNNVLHAVTP